MHKSIVGNRPETIKTEAFIATWSFPEVPIPVVDNALSVARQFVILKLGIKQRLFNKLCLGTSSV